MKNIKIFIQTGIIAAGLSAVFLSGCINFKVNNMQVFSNSFKDNDFIPLEQAYPACGGKNISPDLKWTNIPEGTKSFAIIAHDPDAPVQGGWYHWIVIDIPKETTSIAKGEKIKGSKELKNDFLQIGYGGPCPPKGCHRYNFTVYALNTDKLEVTTKDLPKDIESKAAYHSIGQAVITGLYKR